MFRSLFLIVLLCGVIGVSVVFTYRARAAMSECSARTPCIRDVKPPDCERVSPLLQASCEMWEVPAWNP